MSKSVRKRKENQEMPCHREPLPSVGQSLTVFITSNRQRENISKYRIRCRSRPPHPELELLCNLVSEKLLYNANLFKCILREM